MRAVRRSYGQAAWGLVWISIATGALTAGCTAMDPQASARQYAPSYYNQPYDSLSAEQKMQLEDHLAQQSNQAWGTGQVASGLGHLGEAPALCSLPRATKGGMHGGTERVIL